MKKKLLLYLSNIENHENVFLASTLSWLASSKDYIFDNYYDSYHQGIHFPGGDSRNIEIGGLTGGTVCGDRHFEELYFLLNNFDVSVVMQSSSMFLSSLRNMDVPIISSSSSIRENYETIFGFFNSPLPSHIVMIGSEFSKALEGLDAYTYPEIYYREALGLPDLITDEDLSALCPGGGKIYCLYLSEEKIASLKEKGYDVEVVDSLGRDDNYLTLTERIAKRWKDKVKGWILGDPLLVTHWLPKACEDGLISLYSVPQEKIVSTMGEFISSKGSVVYGRQYSDRDFFELSKLDQCLQVIDPCRPPFQSVRHLDYQWHTDNDDKGFYEDEYSDEELKKFAREGRILVSLVFWSGMIREVANFYNLMDLFAMARLKCGLVVTAQNFEYMMHSPFELLTIPLEKGGVYPLVEPLLGSCGIGVGIESLMSEKRIGEDLADALKIIRAKVNNDKLMPRGLWTTMDSPLEELKSQEKPKPLRFMNYPPYMQFRFHQEDKTYDDGGGSSSESNMESSGEGLMDKIKNEINKAGLRKYFERYRPYEFFKAGPMKESIAGEAKRAGMKYMFTKSGFLEQSRAEYIDEDFIGMNYTAGQWDGWTPFETINDVSDLKRAEKKISRTGKPGWVVSTIDSCLWTFSGEFWKRGSRLYDIATFCASGGRSGRLINVKPHTVARYARLIHESNNY